MSRTQHLRELAERGATEGERAAARRALGIHEAKLMTAIPEPEKLPPGPDMTRRGGPFPAREHDGVVWVAVRGSKGRGVNVGPLATAESWVAERRRMLVRLDGERLAMIPTVVEADDERQQVYVTAPVDSLTEW